MICIISFDCHTPTSLQGSNFPCTTWSGNERLCRPDCVPSTSPARLRCLHIGGYERHLDLICPCASGPPRATDSVIIRPPSEPLIHRKLPRRMPPDPPCATTRDYGCVTLRGLSEGRSEPPDFFLYLCEVFSLAFAKLHSYVTVPYICIRSVNAHSVWLNTLCREIVSFLGQLPPETLYIAGLRSYQPWHLCPPLSQHLTSTAPKRGRISGSVMTWYKLEPQTRTKHHYCVFRSPSAASQTMRSLLAKI